MVWADFELSGLITGVLADIVCLTQRGAQITGAERKPDEPDPGCAGGGIETPPPNADSNPASPLILAHNQLSNCYP
jgi:hypothetical protein